MPPCVARIGREQALVRRLADESLARANLLYLPDRVERRVYENVYRLTLG